MKVKELIKILNELDGEREICLWDCEYSEFQDIDRIEEEAKVRYKRKWYNEMWWDIEKWDLNDYEHADEYGYDIISKEDIYLIL